MILEDDEAKARLDSSLNLSTRLMEIRKLKEGGRRLGDVSVPPALRSLIGSLAVQGDESQKDIAEAFGITQPSVSSYERGMVGNRRDSEIEEAIEKTEGKVEEAKQATIEEAHQAALNVMVSSLGVISKRLAGESPGVLKTKDLSRIATDMSRIVSVATGQDKNNNIINNTKVVVYAPQQRKETSYDIIEA